MDIVEFTEKLCGCELLPYQKEILIKMEEMRKEGKPVYVNVFPGRAQGLTMLRTIMMYIYGIGGDLNEQKTNHQH